MGLLHGELTSLLWGGAFGFVWLYVALAGLVASRSTARRADGSSLGVVPDTGLVFQTVTVPRAPALFGWFLVVEGVHSPGRTFTRRHTLEPTVVIEGPTARGLYHTTARWELADAFGFVLWSPLFRWDARLVVPPVRQPFAVPAPPRVGHGAWRPRRTGSQPGDPFDVRPYHPGDDLRRLHWPLYAHSGQPFVRTADPSPPTGRWHLVLDTECRDEEELDHRLGALVSWLELLEHRREDWTLEVPGAVPVVTRPGQPWLEALAGLQPGTLPATPHPGAFVLVTGPHSRGGRVWTEAGVGFQTVVIEPPLRAAAPRRPWWAR